MHLRITALTVGIMMFATAARSQQSTLAQMKWTIMDSGTKASFRGLSVPHPEVIWASGTRGTFLRSIDGGKNWQADSMAGATYLDFRDVHAVDANTAYLMSAGPGERSRIYKTIDGGRAWKLQFTMQDSAGFLDGFEFWDAQNGIAFGDPLEERLFVLTTNDGGNRWHGILPEDIPPVSKGEYAFAASGSSIAVQGKSHVWIGTGGTAARVFHSEDGGKNWVVANTPMPSGSESAGIFSLTFSDEQTGIAVGGDFRRPNEVLGSVALTKDAGQTWTLAKEAQLEFRSGIIFVPQAGGKLLVTVGTSGSDFSRDGGLTWVRIDNTSFNVVSARATTSPWAAGAEGKIAKLSIRLEP